MPRLFQQQKNFNVGQTNEVLSVRVFGGRIYSLTTTEISVWDRQVKF